MASRQQEFEQNALPHSQSLLRTARRLSADGAEAEDLVQETYLLAWRSYGQFRRDSNMRAWLFRILLNAFYARGRKQRATPVIVPLAEGDAIAETADFDKTEILGALAALPVEQRTVLLLGVVEGFTCREMADILSLPIGTVMSRLSRARHALRHQMTASANCVGKESS